MNALSQGGEFYYFKEPASEDIMETEVSFIVKGFPKLLIIKHKLCFKATEIINMVMC